LDKFRQINNKDNKYMDANRFLYKYIVAQYGDVVNFSNVSGISLINLNAVLLKDNVSKEICMGLNLFHVLNIDVEKMVFDGQIQSVKNEKTGRISDKTGKIYDSDEIAKHEIYNKCMRLSEIEKRKVLEYIESVADVSG